MYRSSPLQVLDMCKVCTEADRFEQNPAAGQILRNRPAGQITPNRLAGQITPNRPAGQITLNRPAGQTGWLAGIKIVNEIRVQWHPLKNVFPALFSSTLPQYFSTTLFSNTSLQRSCAILLYNVPAQYFSTALFSCTSTAFFANTSLQFPSPTL